MVPFGWSEEDVRAVLAVALAVWVEHTGFTPPRLAARKRDLAGAFAATVRNEKRRADARARRASTREDAHDPSRLDDRTLARLVRERRQAHA